VCENKSERKREREQESEREKAKERGRERESMCVKLERQIEFLLMCVCSNYAAIMQQCAVDVM